MKQYNKKRTLSKVCSVSLSLMMAMSVVSNNPMNGQQLGTVKADTKTNDETGTYNYELPDNVQNGSILQAWNWSYNTLAENMELIAQSGYAAIQTSPCTQPKDYAFEGVVSNEVGFPGYPSMGNWWKLYQPVTMSVCNNGMSWLGTKDELINMCREAEKYGVKVLVDVVANHMGNITGWKNQISDVSRQVGEYWNPDMLTDESYWHINDYQCWMSDSRLHFTMGSVGMPDLNTADKKVQAMITAYLDELIDCGVDGFRFDCAKHIETPDDGEFASDFWPVVLGQAKSYYTQKTGKQLYAYGEVLNTVGDNFDIGSYTKYMSVTDNSAGSHLLDAFRNGNINGLSLAYNPSSSVIYVESHDTYMNEASRFASDCSVVRGFSMVANKCGAASMYFARPYYSADILEGDRDNQLKGDYVNTVTPATMGNCETYTWASKEVAAINHFKNRFQGVWDNMGAYGNIAYCFRGNGVVLADFNGSENIAIPANGMANGTYKDEVSGNTFTVSNGTLYGRIDSPYGVAVVYQNVMPNPTAAYPVQIKSSVGDGTSFYTNKLDVTLEAIYADSASYTTSTGESGTLSGPTTISIGEGLEDGESVTLTVTASNSRGTKTATYTYTRNVYDMTNCIFFKNTNNWDTPTAYLWNATLGTPVNSGWPGQAMVQIDADEKIYALQIDPDAGYTKVIFSNNGGSQSSDLDVADIGYMYNPSTSEWTLYYTANTPVIKSSLKSCTISTETDVTYSVSNADSATYSLNGAAPVSFLGDVTLTVGKNVNDGHVDTVVITATKGSETKTVTYEYTMQHVVPTVTSTVEDGATFVNPLTVSFEVKDAKTATISDGTTTESFTGTVTKTINDTTTFTIVANNGIQDYTYTYTFTKKEYSLDDYVLFKNTAGWTTPTVYMWNDTVSPYTQNADWPGEAMVEVDATNGIYGVLIEDSESYNKVIFSNNGGSQTEDLDIPAKGYVYNYNTGVWSIYNTKVAPTISASVESKDISAATEVTYTVNGATNATYTVNGGAATSFSGSVTLTVGENLAIGNSDVVEIVATNQYGTSTASYTYTMTEVEKSYVYFNIDSCYWYLNDSAVPAVKFNTQSEYTACTAVTYNGCTYYQAEVPEGATGVSLARMLPSGLTYNANYVTLANGCNVWYLTSSGSGGNWTTIADLD